MLLDIRFPTGREKPPAIRGEEAVSSRNISRDVFLEQYLLLRLSVGTNNHSSWASHRTYLDFVFISPFSGAGVSSRG